MLALIEVLLLFGLSLTAGLTHKGSAASRFIWFFGTGAVAFFASVLFTAFGYSSLGILGVLIVGTLACIAGSAGNRSSSEKTKQCAFCAETILADAIKCRYCGESLPLAMSVSPPPLPINFDEFRPSLSLPPSQVRPGPIFVAGLIAIAVVTLSLIVYWKFFQEPNDQNSSSRPRVPAMAEFTLPLSLLERGASDTTAKDGVDELGPIIAGLGLPEADDSTLNDLPRPPIVTRWIEYRPENVKILLLAIGTAGSPPPYSGWKVIGYTDIGTGIKISNTEAAERLKTRIGSERKDHRHVTTTQPHHHSEPVERTGAPPEPIPNPSNEVNSSQQSPAPVISAPLQASASPGIGDVYSVGQGVSAPIVLTRVEPEYSEEARKARWQGMVVASLIIDEQGRPQQIKVLRSPGFGLDQKVIEAVEQWRFSPGMKDGKAVSVASTIEIYFQLL